MPSPSLDLDAYFRRIGFAGRAQPNLATLQVLHRVHAEAIAFENLSPFLGETVKLDLAAIQDKIVRRGRGGYCYEQNLLFKAVLEAVGFAVTGLLARVMMGRPEGSVGARSHMLMRVESEEGPQIADVGFGGLTLTAPLRLGGEGPQATPHERFRLVRFDEGYRLEGEVAGAWRPLYRFDLSPQYQSDYEVANYYAGTAPWSPFVTGLIAARPFAGGRFALSGRDLAIHRLGEPTERRTLDSAAALRRVLEEDFRIALPDGARLDRALADVAAG